MNRLAAWLRTLKNNLKIRSAEYLVRRPHRSFRRTRRRDYDRTLEIPGYIALTASVLNLLWGHKKLFGALTLLYVVLTIVFIGLGSEQAFTSLRTLLSDTGGEIFDGNIGQLSQAALLLTTSIATGLNFELNGVQRVYSALLVLLIWLTSVWLLRAVMIGKNPRLRDALYSAGAPIVPTFLISLVLLIQLLPLAVAIIGIQAMIATEVKLVGLLGVLVFTVAGLLGVLTLYLIAGSLFALIIITLPGVYPLYALRTAGDIVTGRRLRLLYRLLWLVLTIVVGWIVIAIPIILLDAWLKEVFTQISWLPVIPVLIVVLSATTLVWASSYIYVLYRKVVDDQSLPA